jgi:ferredoxin
LVVAAADLPLPIPTHKGPNVYKGKTPLTWLPGPAFNMIYGLYCNKSYCFLFGHTFNVLTMLDNFKIWYHQGKQYIPDVTTSQVPGIFRGRPGISKVKVDEEALCALCPTRAIQAHPVAIDLGRCTFCGECAFAFPQKIRFTTDYKMATNERERLIIREGQDEPITLNEALVRKEIRTVLTSSN